MEVNLINKDKKVVGKALVSPEDYEKVSKYSWTIYDNSKDKKHMYAQGYVEGRTIKMHKLIMGKPPSKELVIDHINRNGLDNRRCNLRFATQSANNQNRQKKDNTTSIYIGVSRVCDKYVASQCNTRLGSFDDEIEAAKHYDKYVTIKYDGVCNTNFPVATEDIEGLQLEDLILTKTKQRELPDNITYDGKRNKFVARKDFQGHKFKSKRVDTLDEAQEELKQIDLKIKTIQDIFIKEHFEKPIERNAENQAIITINDNKNELVSECIVDDQFWHELSLYSWSMGTHGYAQSKINNENVSMHSFLMKKTQSTIDIIDHINHNRIDNRLCNLRCVNAAINAHNRIKKEGCTSQYIGVSKDGERWKAYISINGKRVSIGRYENELLAAKAYNEKAKSLYKENANLNIFED